MAGGKIIWHAHLKGLKSNLQFPNQLGGAVTGHHIHQSCCLAEQEIAGNSLFKGDEYDVF